MSMVGQYMLYQISRRLQEAKPHKGTEPFAGVSIILMGDFAQLPPVKDLPLFQKSGGSQFQARGRCLYYENFKTTLTLKESMRQKGKDQELFRNILNSIAKGDFKKPNWIDLRDNTFRLNSEGGRKFLKDAVKLCATNKSSISCNIQKIPLLL